MIINMNLTEYMCPPDRLPQVEAYALAVDAAVDAGKLSGPFTTTCPECEETFPDLDAAIHDDNHIIVGLTSDTFAVVVACEGYFVVNPNLVGIDSPGWMGPNDEFTIITPEGVDLGTPGAPAIVISREDVQNRLFDTQVCGICDRRGHDDTECPS